MRPRLCLSFHFQGDRANQFDVSEMSSILSPGWRLQKRRAAKAGRSAWRLPEKARFTDHSFGAVRAEREFERGCMRKTFPIPSHVVLMIRDSARSRGLRGGRDEAILSALGDMGRDLLPGFDPFDAFFGGETKCEGAAPGWRDIGDAFWRGAGTTLEQRRMEGSFYTPDAVIDRILDMAWNDIHGEDGRPSGTVCDPAVGCGYFPLRLVERLKKRHGLERTRRWAAESLYGVDRDPAAVFVTRALLWLVLSDRRGDFVPEAAHFPCGDSLLGACFSERTRHSAEATTEGLDWKTAFPDIAGRGGFDAIIGNPPYEVLTNFSTRPESRALARALRESGHYRDSLSGQINLYRCFVERSLEGLRPGGVLSMVVPLSLARDAAALPLRRRLLETENAEKWLLFGERDKALGGVTQSACVFKARRGAGAAARLAVSAMGETNGIALAELRAIGGGTLAIPMLDRAGLRLWRWLYRHVLGRVDDAARMRVGEVDQTFFRDCMRDADTGCLLARGSHLSPFVLDVEGREGRERFLDLELFLRKKGASAEACRERAASWRVAQLGIRNMETRPRLVAALVPPGVYLGNSLNVYAPAPGVRLEFLAGVLNSRLLDWLFRVGSGNNNINLAEMRGLPFPAGCAPELAENVAEAYQECVAAIAAGRDTTDGRRRLDAAVETCYQVPGDLLAPVFVGE